MTTPLRLAREKRGLTIQQVANSVGIDPGNLSRIERGLQVPSKDLAEKLSLVFDGDVSETQIIYPERFVPTDHAAPPPGTGAAALAPRLGASDPGHA
ncbi:helix-turn-helix transcriptional regulator [Achromobacter seleniivolatilans]|uniref:Helix-turn-helix transcriptional regulator n=1 Tax=Achromobacter seleniivolatilans TaxID=3047478 RepID=A0ABY9M9M5_9BURK|nr:helix-turn-helix transcriptional regulator [Achromobacter sp. R39]WMD23328.1 helix-turn-helix transcriptional regulator [Achromobacter sp. R39]